MQIERFNEFVQALKDSQSFRSLVQSFSVVRHCEGKWYDENGSVITDENQLRLFVRTLERNSHWKEQKSIDSYYPVADLQAAVRARNVQPPRQRTRDKIQRAISECLRISNNAFDATHKLLTGLLNARELDARIISILAKGATSEGSDLPTTASAAMSLALMMFDLDHFKQVNDSYGHDYGDLVLSSFAERLRKAVISFTFKGSESYQVIIAQPGGEESLVAVLGPIKEETLLRIAEHIRTFIATNPLPTDAEWQQLPSERRSGGIQLPPIIERVVTTSVGVSSIWTVAAAKEIRAKLSQLKVEADSAMLRAKAGGRNTVRYFPSILLRFGSVLKHHSETDIVAIDIGQKIGVMVGQEFHVFHPDFVGGKPFLLSDGRTIRRTGEYPRHASGRIIVFDVQREISFCKGGYLHHAT